MSILRPLKTARSVSVKSSPTTPTRFTCVKLLAAIEKYVAAPPRVRSVFPYGVSSASNATEPTTKRDMNWPLSEIFPDDGRKAPPCCRRDECWIGYNRVRQGFSASASPLGGHRSHGCAQNALCVFRVTVQIGDDLRHGPGAVFRVPAIVIRDHGDGGIAQLSLPSELRFGNIRHADDLETELPVHVGLGERRKLGALHAHVRASAMRLHADGVACFSQHPTQLRADGPGKSHMSDNPVAEKGRSAPARAVVKLIGNQKIQRSQVLLQGADSAHRNHALDAEKLHGVNVGAIIDFRRREAMAPPVAREKRHAPVLYASDHKRIGWLSEWCFYPDFSCRFGAGHRVESAATNDSNLGLSFAASW